MTAPGRFTAHLPDDVHLVVGQVVRIPLVGAVGGGYTWTAAADPADPVDPADPGRAGAPVARVDVERVAPPRPQPPGEAALPPSSDAMTEILVVEGLARGVVVVVLHLARGWAPDPALAVHRLSVHVLAG